jgi:hypothetical protein
MANAFWNCYQGGKLKFLIALLIAALPSGGLFLLLQVITGASRPWIWYLCGCIFYTIAVFTNAYIDRNSILFSKSDHRTKVRLLAVHVCFVCILCSVVLATTYLKPHLPNWMFVHNKKGGSWADLLFIAVTLTVYSIEEDWLATKRK